MQSCNRIIIPTFSEGSTCFERHTAHHQDRLSLTLMDQ